MWEFFVEGGWGMVPIAICSVFILGIIIERAIFLYGASINRDVFLATMQKCILAGDIPKAVKMCSAANVPLARIVQAGLVKVNRPDGEVQAAMDEAALHDLARQAGLQITDMLHAGGRAGDLSLIAVLKRTIVTAGSHHKACPMASNKAVTSGACRREAEAASPTTGR